MLQANWCNFHTGLYSRISSNMIDVVQYIIDDTYKLCTDANVVSVLAAIEVVCVGFEALSAWREKLARTEAMTSSSYN